jgi:hypothetical protein
MGCKYKKDFSIPVGLSVLIFFTKAAGKQLFVSFFYSSWKIE